MDLPTPEDLRERRTELGLTQSELAERADVSQPLIARIEGEDVDPRLSTPTSTTTTPCWSSRAGRRSASSPRPTWPGTSPRRAR